MRERAWVVAAGTYGIEVGRAATDLPLRADWLVSERRAWAP